VRLLGAVQALIEHILARSVFDRPLLSNRPLLDRYLRASMGTLDIELFRVLFLDTHLRLIRDETMWEGTIDQVATHPREVAKRAIEVGAAALIVIHNHPRGEPVPSRADKEFTRLLAGGLSFLNIKLADHLVVAGAGVGSFRDLGLL
jgi:DNA repair protein RadC